jgi:hypothetical protein
LKKIFLFIIFLSLNGCMSAQEIQANFDSKPASKICYDYYNYPDYNIWQGDRLASIKRRGLDCTPYMAEAIRNKRITEGLLSVGQALSQPQTTTTTGFSTSTGLTKVCYYDGPTGQSAITVGRATVCPITNTTNVSGLTKVCTYNTPTGQKAVTIGRAMVCPVRYPG